MVRGEHHHFPYRPAPWRVVLSRGLTILLLWMAAGCAGASSEDGPGGVLDDAIKAYNTKDFDSAGKLLRQILKEYPDNTEALIYSARLALKDRQVQKARETAQKIIDLKPAAGEGYAFLGKSYYLTASFDEALEYSRQAIEKDSKLILPYKVIGEIYLRRGRRQEGLKVLKHAVQLAPKDPQALNKLAAAHIKLDQHQTALKILQNALQLAPKEPGIHFNLALVYNQLEQGNQALDHIQTAQDLYLETGNTRWLGKARQTKHLISKKFNLELPTDG